MVLCRSHSAYKTAENPAQGNRLNFTSKHCSQRTRSGFLEVLLLKKGIGQTFFFPGRRSIATRSFRSRVLPCWVRNRPVRIGGDRSCRKQGELGKSTWLRWNL